MGDNKIKTMSMPKDFWAEVEPYIPEKDFSAYMRLFFQAIQTGTITLDPHEVKMVIHSEAVVTLEGVFEVIPDSQPPHAAAYPEVIADEPPVYHPRPLRVEVVSPLEAVDSTLIPATELREPEILVEDSTAVTLTVLGQADVAYVNSVTDPLMVEVLPGLECPIDESFWYSTASFMARNLCLMLPNKLQETAVSLFESYSDLQIIEPDVEIDSLLDAAERTFFEVMAA